MSTEQQRRWFFVTEATLSAFATCIEYGHAALVKEEIDQMLATRTPLTDEQMNAIRAMLRMVHQT